MQLPQQKKVQLTNPDKIYWPEQKYTKSDLLNYYQQVAPYILPYLKNRPMVLRRFPDGIDGENFIQKDTQSLHLPDWIQTVEIEHETKKDRYLLIQNEETLEYVVNLGAIELHPFHSQIDHAEYPDYFVLDLDPEAVSFDIVIQTAQTIHKLMDKFAIPHYCKTSGGRGLHIYVPLHGKYTFEQVSPFGQLLVALIQQELPEITSLERSPEKRQNKIYLDVLQNSSKKTIIAPYSVRGKPFAPVSTPLHWDELVKGVRPTDYTMKTIIARLQKVGDIFTPVLGKGFNLKKWVNDLLKNE
jgi:bifunctional non-homologous end joining protein LigD